MFLAENKEQACLVIAFICGAVGTRYVSTEAGYRFRKQTVLKTYFIYLMLPFSGNACYYSVQNRLSSRLLSKNVKVRIYKAIILPVVLYGCET
jgi:hypothetical protein